MELEVVEVVEVLLGVGFTPPLGQTLGQVLEVEGHFNMVLVVILHL